MTAVPIIYQPKGGMCMTCQHSARDCSPLVFHAMPRIAAYPGAVIVRCTEHVRRMP